MIDLNSAAYWLPRVTAAGLPVPRTLAVPYDHGRLVASLCGEGDYRAPVADVAKAARRIGLPVFVRGEHCSAKHQGPRAYRWDGASEDDLARILHLIAEDTETKLFFHPDPANASFLVREWLDLKASFAAFGHTWGFKGRVGHPIAREWRLFAFNNGAIACAHPYWDPDAFDLDNQKPWGSHPESGRPMDGPKGWRDALADLEQPLPLREAAPLHGMAALAAKVCPEGDAWSVDFAKDRAGKWWLIDMALAAQSHHRAGCPTNTWNPRPEP